MRTATMLAALLLLSTVADATLCRRRNGVLVVRDGACRTRERVVTASEIGAVGATGAEGPRGPEGPAGPAGPGARWALVSGAGTILAQSGGIAIVSSSNGAHVIDFGVSLLGKVLHATTAYTDAESAGNGRVSVGLCGGGAGRVTCDDGVNDDRHVFAFTVNVSNTANAPHPFFVAAF